MITWRLTFCKTQKIDWTLKSLIGNSFVIFFLRTLPQSFERIPSEHVRVQGSSTGLKVQIFAENKKVFALIFAKKHTKDFLDIFIKSFWSPFSLFQLFLYLPIEEIETFQKATYYYFSRRILTNEFECWVSSLWLNSVIKCTSLLMCLEFDGVVVQ